MKIIKRIYKKSVSFGIAGFIHSIKHQTWDRYLIAIQPIKHKRAICRLKNKKVLNFVFFAFQSSMWKYDELYRLLSMDKRFNTLIVVCHVDEYGKQYMINQMDETYMMLKEKGFRVIKAYDAGTESFLDVKKELSPDIIFYTNPYQRLDNRYYVTHFRNYLTCYVSYSSMICNFDGQFERLSQNLMWKMFMENELITSIARREAPFRRDNFVTTGYPSYDTLLDINYIPKSIWRNNKPYKIIWAPHHTIGETGLIFFSSFLSFSNVMVEIAHKYEENVQFAFKPHPHLYPKLLKIWGKTKADAYYNLWNEMPNTQLEDGEYFDLFLTSSAIIFDSVSFINEYLYTKKPSLFIDKGDIKKQLNEFGLFAYNCHQVANSEEEIISFIDNIVHDAYDPKIVQKNDYFKNYLIPPNDKSASRNIFDNIVESLNI